MPTPNTEGSLTINSCRDHSIEDAKSLLARIQAAGVACYKNSHPTYGCRSGYKSSYTFLWYGNKKAILAALRAEFDNDEYFDLVGTHFISRKSPDDWRLRRDGGQYLFRSLLNYAAFDAAMSSICRPC